MKWYHLWILSVVGSFLPAVTFGGEGPSKIGIVKGTITIGGRPISEAVVSVEDLSKEDLKAQISSLKPKSAVMDQQDLRFLPHVLPVLVGTSVEFANNDKTFHNVFSTSEAKKFDLGLYSPGRRRRMTFDKPGVVKILCNVHPSMEAYVVVKEHPYFAATDKRGSYQVTHVPLGKYRIEVWHPELGTRALPFELVREGQVLAIDVDLKK